MMKRVRMTARPIARNRLPFSGYETEYLCANMAPGPVLL